MDGWGGVLTQPRDFPYKYTSDRTSALFYKTLSKYSPLQFPPPYKCKLFSSIFDLFIFTQTVLNLYFDQ